MLKQPGNSITANELDDKLWAIVQSNVENRAQHTAVATRLSSISYGELNQRANQIARSLEVDKGTGVGLILADADAIHISSAMLGVLKAASFFVYLDPALPVERLKFLIEEANIKALISDNAHIGIAQSASQTGLKLINVEELDLSSQTQNLIPSSSPADLIQVIFTSGSTGQPKGVLEDYLSLNRALADILAYNALTSADIFLNTRSFNFGTPHQHLFACLLVGATFFHHHVGAEGLVGFSEVVKNAGVTVITISPTLFRQLVHSLDAEASFPTVRLVSIGGEPVNKQDALAFQKYFPSHSCFKVGFGTSETFGLFSKTYPHHTRFDFDIFPVGHPSPGVEFWIVDENGNELPQGEAGEILVRGSRFSPGYLNNPELTREKFRIDPRDPDKRIVHLGDLGKVLPDGQLFHLGRIDTMIKIHGLRIELESIEHHILEYPGIVQAAVRGYLDKKGNQKLAGYYIPDDKVQINRADLRQFLTQKLPLNFIPHVLIQLDELPLTQTGKVDRKVLPQPNLVRPALENPYTPPANQVEKQLVQIWEDVIGIVGIGTGDDFFDLGGDSLAGVMLFLEIEKQFGMNLPLSLLLQASTIKGQVKFLQDSDVPLEWSPIIPLKASGSGTPVFLIPGRGGYPLRFRGLARRLPQNTPVYAMQARGLDGMKNPFDTVEASARYYIDEIRKIKAQGPYFLGGESSGGLIAYEMARQLHQVGEAVPLLALFDTYGPGQVNPLLFQRKARVRVKYNTMLIRKHFSILAESDWEGKKEYIQYYLDIGRIRLQQLRQKIARWRAKRQAPAGLPPELQRVEQLTMQAAQKYVPKPYPGRVILFRAMRNPSTIDATNGWDRVDTGVLVVHDLDCFHGNILFEPTESQIAHLMTSYIIAEAPGNKMVLDGP